MREIEIKARVANLDEIVKKLEVSGYAVSAPVKQRDQVFGLPNVDGGENNHAPWLRIRTEVKGENEIYLFTLKKSVTSQLDSIEHETEITDPNELEQIILHSGFEPYSDITKTRRKAKIGAIELCLDVVDKLGDFIEAEKLTSDDADYRAVMVELWQLFDAYGIARSDEVTDGYDVMIKKLEG